MARAYSAPPPNDYSAAPGEWQALRGELVALLDRVEGQYAQSGEADFAAVAQRMRDLRFQIADDGDPMDRHREALRSVKRQIERFNERGEAEAAAHADNLLQTAIQQIRARTQGEAPPARPRIPGAPLPEPDTGHPATGTPRYEEMARAMGNLSSRLEQLEAELRAQRGNAAQVKEIADQVAQLSQVVELVAGAVGETGQVKRLESQIAGLAELIGRTPKLDLAQINERLDTVAATVDRLADLQVQQIQHTVREASEEPRKDTETADAMRAIEAGIRNVYDRLDALENNHGGRSPELEQIASAVAQISEKIGSDTRPERLLGLVDALNGRINDIEDRGDALAGLKGDLNGLRDAVVSAMEPRLSAVEARLGSLGEQLNNRPAPAEVPGIAQLEAQVRQLVARMDQTGEQLTELARAQSAAPAAAPAPDFEALASLAATRSLEAMQQQQPPPPPVPDFEQLADMAAIRAGKALFRPDPDFEQLAELTAQKVAGAMPPPAPLPDFEALADQAARKAIAAIPEPEPDTRPTVSEASLAAFESRMTRLVESFVRARSPEGSGGMTTGLARIEDRLQQLEAALRHRPAAPAPQQDAKPVVEPPASPEPPAAASEAASVATPVATPVGPPAPAVAAASPDVPTREKQAPSADARKAATADDAMPRNPAADAPLKEFGFPDLGPVRAALEAKNGPRKLHPGLGKPGGDNVPTTPAETPEVAADADRPLPPPSFDPAAAARPPRPRSSLDDAIEVPFSAPTVPQPPVPAAPEVSSSSRNTFIEAARRAAQRQNPPRPQPAGNSIIGKAFSRVQPATVKAEAEVRAPEPVPPAPAEVAKPPKRGLFRRAPVAEGVAELPEAASAAPVAEGAAADESATTPPKESFLLRHRRAILLGASIIAITFMTANLVLQRMAAGEGDQASDVAASVPAPAPASAAPAKPKPAPDAAKPAAAAPKPVSSIAPPKAAVSPAVALAPAPPAPPASQHLPTDPVATASIDPGPAMSYAPPKPASTALPPPLAAANAAVTGPAPVVENASLATPASPVDQPAAAADTVVASATPSSSPAVSNPAASTPAPAALDSPVRVELPPEGIGPLDLRQAAADGDARAQFEIAAIYSEGRAVPQDFKQAAIWYERAAAQGFGPAQYRLGNLYENGKGVDKDLEQARLWYQRAAEAGNRMAMHNLAALYAGGQFGKQDFSSAAEWFERASNLGMKDSQFNLGMLFARGLGVPQNMEESYKWFALAATGGDPDATKARDNVARSLDADAMKRAQAAVAAFKLEPVNLAANFAPLGTWDKRFNPGPVVTDKGVITKVQIALSRLGFDTGPADGHAGPKTIEAIKAFERGTGMSEVGQVNPRLLAVLGSQPV